MSSMDIDRPEKEELASVASAENAAHDVPALKSPSSKQNSLKDKRVNGTEQQVNGPSLPPHSDKSCKECQEKEVECTHLTESKIQPSRDYVPDSDDDSSSLSDVPTVPSPELSRASISESTKVQTEAQVEVEDSMDVDSPKQSSPEGAESPNQPETADEAENAATNAQARSRQPSPSSSVNIILDKPDAASEAPEKESDEKLTKEDGPVSPSAQLLTPGTGAGSLSNTAPTPVTTVETEQEPESEPEPAIELTDDEKEDLAKLTAMFSSISPAVARAAVQENALKCLLGSSSDEVFFFKTILSGASDRAITKVLKTAGQRILEVAAKSQTQFLDRALEMRLQSIDGTKLARCLGRAGRLGFEEQDDVDGESAIPLPLNVQAILAAADAHDQHGQHGMPLMQPQPNGGMWNQPPPGYMYNPAYPRPDDMNGHGLKACHMCGATFKQNAGLRYHVDKEVCKKAGVPQGPVMARCDSCGKEFRSPGGYHYHMTNNVCGNLLKKSPSPGAHGEEEHAEASATPQPQVSGALVPAAPNATHTPVQAALPHMFQNIQQQPYQGPYQNPPPQPMAQHQPLPSPAQVVPSMSASKPRITTNAGEQIIDNSGVLTPAQAQKLNEDLRAEDRKFEEQIKNISPELQGQARELEIKRLKAGMSTRKSNLRRKHGIFVRKTDKTPANAVRNDDGGIEIVPAGTSVTVGAGFAPINRLENGIAPAPPASSSRAPESPAEGAPDAKRRRVSEYPSGMTPANYPSGPTGYPPNYNMHPGSYDPRHQHQQMMQGQYQQYSMSPYTQSSPYQQPPQQMHPPYGQPVFQMNTIIPAPHRAPGASPSTPMMQGPPPNVPPPGYYQGPSGFVSVNQPPSQPTPPPGYMLGPPQPQSYFPPNGHTHGHPQLASGPASSRASSAGQTDAQKGKTIKPKVPIDDAEKVWKAKAKERDWVVQTGPQHAFTRMEKDGKRSQRGSVSQERDGGGAEKSGSSKKKAKSEFIIPISDDELTDEDEGAKRPSMIVPENEDDAAKQSNGQGRENERRESNVSSELSDLDESMMDAGAGGEPIFIRSSDGEIAPAEDKGKAVERPSDGTFFKPANKPAAVRKPPMKAQNRPVQPSAFGAGMSDGEDYLTDDLPRRPPPRKPTIARPPIGRPPAKAPVQQVQADGANDDDLEPGNEILQVASDDEMVIDTPPARQRPSLASQNSSSMPPPPSGTASGTASPASGPLKKKRLGRPVGWKKGMGGYRELLDAGVVHHNLEGTSSPRRRASRARHSTGGEGMGEAGPSSAANGANGMNGRKSVGGHETGGAKK